MVAVVVGVADVVVVAVVAADPAADDWNSFWSRLPLLCE